MVKVERSPNAPASLAVESQKACGDYKQPDVVLQLENDFRGKCYLCEIKDLTDPEVEHLVPHHGRKLKHLVFDWNNLFYACRHCNSVKNNPIYDGKILDCCQTEPESLLNHIFHEGHVHISPQDSATCDEKILMTSDLIQNCFERKNTGIRIVACQTRVKNLALTMNTLFKTLNQYTKNSNSTLYYRRLCGLLSREHAFAAFTRHYVRSHLDDYPALAGLVTLQEAEDI